MTALDFPDIFVISSNNLIQGIILDGLLFQKMGFIQNTYHSFILDATDDLDLVLELAFCVSAVKPGLDPKLVKQPFIEPSWCQF